MRFVAQSWAIVEPKQPFVSNWHITEIAEELQRISRGVFPVAPDGREADGLVINVPAGTTKTLLAGVMWPAWVWASDPTKRFLYATYSLPRTIDGCKNTRSIVESEWYRERYRAVQLRADQNMKTRFDTTARGWVIGVAVGGEGTGLHPDFIVIDDALSADDARSEVKRQTAVDWFEKTISTRGMTRRAFVVHIAQRLHEDDLAGVMLRTGRYAHIRFPMYYEPALPEGARPKNYLPPDPRDPRRVEGELLCPQLIPEAKARAVERVLGNDAAGQFQQRPAPLEGLLFKRSWFKVIGGVPAPVDDAVRFWDVAGTETGQGARTAGVKMLRCGPSYVIVDAQVDRLSAHGVDALMLQTARLDGPLVRVREEQEPGSAGKAVCAARTTLLAGFDYKGIPSTGDKVLRANPLRSQAEAGNVFLLIPEGREKPPWVEEFLSEVTLFPNGKLKDQVDAASGAFSEVTAENVGQMEYVY